MPSGWDRNAPPFGDLAVGDGFQKHSYPFGIMVNANGERFVDEGADFRNYTYAKYGRVILSQPQQFAWQIFDQKVMHLLRDEYRIKQVTKVQADTHRGARGEARRRRRPTVPRDDRGVQRGGAHRTCRSIPNVKDGRVHRGPRRSTSRTGRTRIDEPPFEAYAGHLRRHLHLRRPARRHERAGDRTPRATPIPGLFAAGELVGGLFYFNYPGGTGLMAGAVFGRIAGRSAAAATVGSEAKSAVA